MKNTLIIKRVKEHELQEVIQMLQAISNYYPDQSKYSSIWENFISQNNLFAYSFYFKNQLVGYGVFFTEIKIRGGTTAHIEDIVVKNEFRSMGFGKQIIDYLVNKSKEMGCYKISLSCNSKNIKFYENCGFKNGGYTMKKIF